MPCNSTINWSNFKVNNLCSISPWFVTDNNTKLFYYVEDSLNCGGECCFVQSGEATGTISVGDSDIYLTLNYGSIGEFQSAGKERLTLSLNGQPLGLVESKGGSLGCTFGPGFVTEYIKSPILLYANTENILSVSYTTGDEYYHQNCYAFVELIVDCIEPSPTPTPTMTPTPVDCDCPNCWCKSENCPTPTPSRTPNITPSPTTTTTPTNTTSVTPTVTPTTCVSCLYYDIVIDQNDLNASPENTVYVYFRQCGGTNNIAYGFTAAGTYTQEICVESCFIPAMCIGIDENQLNPCIAATGGSSATVNGNCNVLTKSCPTSFSYLISNPGTTLLDVDLSVGQNYGNIPVTISSKNFPQINEVFVGNSTSRFGEIFTFTKGSGTISKQVGFWNNFSTDQNIDIAVYSEGTSQYPFEPFTIDFTIDCPTVYECGITPSGTPCPTPTPSPPIITDPCVVSTDYGVWRIIRTGSDSVTFKTGRIDNAKKLLNLPGSFKFPFYTFGKGVRVQVAECLTKGGGYIWYDVYSMTTRWGNWINFPSNQLVVTINSGIKTFKLAVSPWNN